jgi:hypothetical protein
VEIAFRYEVPSESSLVENLFLTVISGESWGNYVYRKLVNSKKKFPVEKTKIK